MSQIYAPYIIFFIGSFLLAFMQYSILYNAKKFKSSNFFKKNFHIKSGKSSSNAILLGGIPLFVTTLISIGLYFLNEDNINLPLTIQQKNIILRSMLASPFLIFYGYIDDRYEIRPWVKLFFQFFSVTLFTITTSALLTSTNYSNFAFLVHLSIGMALLNGVNLLDGIDGNIVKYTIASLLLYSAISSFFNNYALLFLSTVSLGPVLAFYLFNKEPAKIYMGECGTTFLGLMLLTLSTLSFHHNMPYTTRFKNMGLALLPILLPLLEVAISFSRRLISKSSPFRGDKLHIHHILTTNKRNTHSAASNIISLTFFSVSFTGLMISKYFDIHTMTNLVVCSTILSSLYIFFSRKYWNISFDTEHPIYTIFSSLTKRKVNVIDLEDVQRFELKIIPKDSENDQDVKKAA